MTSNEKISSSYFNWLCNLVCDEWQKKEYSYLLNFLSSVEFKYEIFMDKNRYEDGISLRYRFAQHYSLDTDEVHKVIDEPCSVLEMMVALALRCEENIITSTEYENRTGFLFWEMIKSIGIIDMTNQLFDLDELDVIVSRFLNRDYDRNGAGGLFTIKGIDKDMRDAEIWMQMNWYVSQLI